MGDELPYYETFYGVKIDDWNWDYGAGYFSNTHYALTKEYYSEGVESDDTTSLVTDSNTIRFLFSHWIKRKYYIEGTAIGQFTLSCDGGNSEVSNYEIRLMKIDNLGNVTELGTTDVVVPVNTIFTWDGGLNVGTEIVYPFEIEISPEQEMLNNDRLFVELIIVMKDANGILYHSNDATWEDFKIQIPFRGL